MKLQTSIPPRRDGTITVTAKDGQRFVFAPGPDGELVGEVTHEATVAELLAGGMFFPADPSDFDEALALTQLPPDEGHDDLEASQDGDDAADDGEDDDEGEDESGTDDGQAPLPVEANTPPASFKPAKSGKKAK